MIAICTTIKGRNHALFDYLIPSLPKGVALSVCDCNDESILPQIQACYNGELYYSHIPKEPFIKTPMLNKTEEILPPHIAWLFFADVDMTLPPDFVGQFSVNVTRGEVWFPICFTLDEGASIECPRGHWRHYGYGMCGFFRSDFHDIGRWDEKYTVYGGEDNDMYDRCVKRFKVARENCEGLFHNWHPRKRFGIDG